jgi:NADH dehydrogenase FAD-containing subunit
MPSPHRAYDGSTGKALARVVIVGAGFGGLSVAKGLRDANVDVTIVDRQNHHLFQPLLYQVATAALSPADIAAPIRAIVRRYPKTRVLLDEVIGVDASGKQVSLRSGATLTYDYLVLATGARHSYFGREDWAPYAPGIKTIDDATRVRSMILLAMERAESHRQENIARRDEFLNFVIIGGGPTGVEMAGAIAELTRHAAAMDFHFITPQCVRIVLLEAGDRLLATFPADLGAAALEALGALGVEVRLDSRVTGIDETGVTVGDIHIQTTTVIWAAGFQASEAASWIGAKSDRGGRVEVGPDLTAPGRPDIFVIGDTAMVLDRKGRPAPGIAPAAKQQGAYAAKQIAALSKGRRRKIRFRYRNYGMLATIGRKRAVIDFGRIRLKGLMAWLLWSTAHLYFLVGFRNRFIVGLTWLWNYLTFNRGARLITGVDRQQAATAATNVVMDSAPFRSSPHENAERLR